MARLFKYFEVLLGFHKNYGRKKMHPTEKTVSDIDPHFAVVPSMTFPARILAGGAVTPEHIEPSFLVSRHLNTVVDGKATVQPDGKPTVNINYYKAVDACAAAGLRILTESQRAALAWNIASVADNWASRVVGEGSLRQGLRNGRVYGAQLNSYVPPDPDERRDFTLSNGEVIYDVAGHLFEWVFDNVQGDEKGLVTKPFAESSMSLYAPYPSMEKGTGWRPSLPCNWSGRALLRGGLWYSVGYAGVFGLLSDHPGYGYDYVGFRSTKPIGR